MLSAVLHTISRHGLFTPGDRVLVGVSGGPDSMALLAVLWELAPRLDLALEVASVDHGLRPEAAAERALVGERARALELPWHVLRVEVAAGKGRGGLQEAARRARLAALEACAEERGCAAIALGHQADDQTETVLFRILRGTGLRGLGGIPYRRGRIVRPLLDVPRAEIVGYLARRSLTFAQDPSNQDPRFARARIRHVVLPALRRENPRVDEALRRLAVEADGFAGSGATLPNLARAGAHPSRTREGDADWAEVARAAGIYLPARLKEAVAEAARKGGTTSFDVAGGRRIIVSYGRAAVISAETRDDRTGSDSRRVEAPGRAAQPAGSCDTIISGPGVHRLGNSGVRVLVGGGDTASSPAEARARSAQCAWFDLETIEWPLVLRRPRAGDRMRPRGGRGSRKVSDLFIDAKIPRPDRADHLVVASSAGEVLFIRGLRPSEVAAPTEATRRWLGLTALP
jgi:tRNA(Ile)-lysidine synthase